MRSRRQGGAVCSIERLVARAEQRRRWAERSRGERGVVVVWFALMLIVLLGFAGFAVDMSNWWLQAERLQRAADSGAHAGVVFLPADLNGATTTARAEVLKNGYTTTGANADADIVVTREPNPNRLRVKLTTEVPNYFIGLLGVEDVELTREAVAEYIAPVPMGSPENKLGNDPQNGFTSPQLWLNVAGPNGNKGSGDRYQSKNCPTRVAGCTNTVNAGIQNDEYAFDGYFFSLKVSDVVSGQPLRLQGYDAAMTYVGDYCQVNMPTQAEANALRALPGNPYPDANVRYAPTVTNDGKAKDANNWYVPTAWCTGDQDIGGYTTETTFIVREPDDTPWNNTDNKVVSNCTITMPVFTPGQNGWDTIYNLLHPTAGTNNAKNRNQHVINPNDGIITFAEVFRRNFTLCEIPSGSVKKGDYILQIRSNATAAKPLEYSSTMTQGGHNRFSLQAGFGTGVNTLDGSKVSINALGRLPIYSNATGANTNFFLARVLPYDAGRTLRIHLYDISDVGKSGTMRIVPPSGGTISGCGFSNDKNLSMSFNANTCTLTVPNGYYNERTVTVDLPIPKNYTCTPAVATDCWFQIRAEFGGITSDTTTWSAAILGNPVRLVE